MFLEKAIRCCHLLNGSALTMIQLAMLGAEKDPLLDTYLVTLHKVPHW